MLRSKTPAIIGTAIFIALFFLLRHDLKEKNISDRSLECETKFLPLEEIRAKERDKLMAPLLNNQTRPDDPRLIQGIRDYFLDPPSELLGKMSNRFIVTPQASKIDLILNQKENGFFIDCGAFDGERASNSIFFEKRRGWTGVLIEMDPSLYMQIRGKNRKAYSLNVCLSPHQYPIKMTFKEATNGQGVLVIDNGKQVKNFKTTYCLPLYSIMLALNTTRVDYFSLDVEGFELDILKTIPFDQLDITTFSVEYEHAPRGGQEYIQFMEERGYHRNCSVGRDKDTYAWDYIFVKKSFLTSQYNPNKE